MTHDLLYIETQSALLDWVNHASQAAWVAIDTESDSFHRYREKVCLIQMTALGVDAIIDPLAIADMQVLAPLMANQQCTKIFHDAVYDLLCLQRDFGFVVQSVFDTMLASRLLGYRQFGLAALLQERFGVVLDKRLQRSDWAQRPLTQEQLHYARADTHYLPELCAMLRQELAAKNRLVWATEDFARLPLTIAQQGIGFSNKRDLDHIFWRVAGVQALSPIQKGRLQALCKWRESLAAKLDKPPFKVMPDVVLLHVAQDPSKSLAPWRNKDGPRHYLLRQHGPHILQFLKQAQPVFETSPPKGAAKRRRAGKLTDLSARALYKTLHTLRRHQALILDVDPEIIMSNALLEDLAKKPPRNLLALQERPEMRGWRGQLFAEALLKVLA